jgi:adenine phosphoribosyltransferase|tara:strand:- start:496 stop:1017 length:522 start_codon:yes stop_codon:yes gene_type:complete
MDIEHLKSSIRNVPDYPKPGIQFKDITPILQDPELFSNVIDIFYARYKSEKIDVIVGIESRGFIFAAPLALKLDCSLAIARKSGKLPYKTISAEYSLEYGVDELELHTDAIKKGDRVLIVDDLLATGGTANAAGELVKKLKGDIVCFAFLINLVELRGIDMLKPHQVFCIIEY